MLLYKVFCIFRQDIIVNKMYCNGDYHRGDSVSESYINSLSLPHSWRNPKQNATRMLRET
ncbi:hypothetical protein DSUL_170041 [Desulfovibrionales bacterium]